MSENREETQHLLQSMGQGNLAAFEQFYKRYVSFVYRICLHMMGDEMEAEDACHDVFMEVLYKYHQYDPKRGSIEAWLAVKTRTRCLDRLRKNHQHFLQAWEEHGDPTGYAISIEDKVFTKLQQDSLYKALKQIPQTQRAALYGAYFENQTQRELAERMKRPLGTIKSLIRYGIQNLKHQFRQEGWISSSGAGGGPKHE